MVTEPNRVEEVFSAALQRKAGPERAAYLHEACHDDAAVRQRVEALLAASDAAGEFLQKPVLGGNTITDESAIIEGPGTVIGRYKLLERIGEGGMAVVYMAEQAEPIRRKVALKIIKLGMDTRQVIARFEAERQALAMMDHPCIAKVLDAGATETGRPYFVMELVTGVSITEYCDKNNLSTKDRLALFLQVCNAVQHAHQKGIIHRDIKPSNVMITHHDGRPVPKVIDFGIAKATNQRLTEKTLFTRYAHIIGTPAYMSPEQAELSDLDIDTRTDIYSLGVLLYELLTGTTPFSEEELRKAGYIEMQRVIREQEPAKPSTKLTTLGDILPEVAKHRSSTPDLLRKAVRGDLDWIVMKSLEKDRARRYETPNSLASDILRHLEHEPVVARGPSTTYHLHKFLRRHQVQAIAALAIAVVAGVVVVILLMWNRDRLQLSEAEKFKHRGILSQAREQYAKADRETALETIKTILDSKHVGPDAQLLKAGILVDNRHSEEARTVLRGLLNERPEVAGAAHSLLARILWESESPDPEKLKEIDEHRRKAEALLPETAEAYFLRAMTAITIQEQLASLAKALQLDPGHYESRRLQVFTYYASRKYDRMREEALAMTILRPRDPLGHSLRAIALRELARYGEAVAEYDQAIALTSKDSPEYIDLSSQRCETLLRMADYERVVAEAQECVRLWPDKSVFQHYVFCALTALGEYDKATALFRRIIAPGQEARQQFQDRSAKYVFDTLEAGRLWHPADREPTGAAFLPMVEAEETYRNLSTKARRVTTDGFSGRWSPDGKKLAFSLGVHGYSGVAIFDPATKETELLIVPGKDPRWSPDGRYIAFVRDCQALRLEQLATAERKSQPRPVADEEVWLMKSDGTEPRRMTRGSAPSWGWDSKHIYYQSRVDNVLCSIAVEGGEPKQIMKCSSALLSMSPDSRQAAYFEAGSLKITNLASQTLVAECPVPSMAWGNTTWSPTGDEVCLGGTNLEREKLGLWIYDLRKKELLSVLDGVIGSAWWSPKGTSLAFNLGQPYYEIWVADLDPRIPTAQALAPSRTHEEHLRAMDAFYTRRIQADPLDAYAYCDRARHYDSQHERAKALADMKYWSAVQRQQAFWDSWFGAARDSKRVMDCPFDCQLVFAVEDNTSETPVLSVAFGQKGRCEMKLFEIPMFVASLFGSGLLAGLDAPPAYADFTFGERVNVKTVIPDFDAAHDGVECFSLDGLEMYVSSDRPGGYGAMDLCVRRRASTQDQWGPIQNLGPIVNSPKMDYAACVSADGLALYFTSQRPGGYGIENLYMTTRTTMNTPWEPPVNLGPKLNSDTGFNGSPWISRDGSELYFASYRIGGHGSGDIYLARRANVNDPWGGPVNLGPVVNSPYFEGMALSLSPDGLLLLFSDYHEPLVAPRPGGYGGSDIWMARRTALSAPWQTPVNLGPKVNGPDFDAWPRLSPDGRMLYYWSGHDAATYSSWQVPIIPIVDFDGDGKVDGKELLAMVVQLGGSDPLCDIGPYAWGDGVVDVEDLKVLAEYIGKEVVDGSLVAHWKLDETEGATAHDSAGESDGIAVGNPTWQPAGGKIDGALACDGVDDFVLTQFKLNPAKGPFSVLAWVKGGAPGEVVLSQQKGADWLYANPIDGSLMTGLMGAGATAGPGFSDVVITDGQWHRIGLVWDGTDRILLVDGQEAARDAQSNLTDCSETLLLGTGKSASGASFWSGLIDDVRVYNRAVQP